LNEFEEKKKRERDVCSQMDIYMRRENKHRNICNIKKNITYKSLLDTHKLRNKPGKVKFNIND